MTVEEEYGHPYNIKGLASKDLGKQVEGLEDLKALGNLPKDFPRTMPDSRQRQSCNDREEGEVYNSVRRPVVRANLPQGGKRAAKRSAPLPGGALQTCGGEKGQL